MKKSLFYLFMLMAVVAMPLTSCEKDPQKEDGQHDFYLYLCHVLLRFTLVLICNTKISEKSDMAKS